MTTDWSIPNQPASRSIFLWGDGEYRGAMDDGFLPWLDPFLLDTPAPCGAVLVCPGGGYGGRSPREADPVAQRFNSLGFHAFVVHYSVAPRRHPQPASDISRAVRIVRSRGVDWGVNTSKIAVCGFSAGGHLAASSGVLYGRDYLQEGGSLGRVSNRPDALILSYPVITAGEFAHRGSFDNLLGENPAPEALNEVSLELQVTPDTPPAFLWHTVDDEAVPVENSVLFASALRMHKVPFEMHLYPSGPHGYALASEETHDGNTPNNPHIAGWIDLCADWIRAMGF